VGVIRQILSDACMISENDTNEIIPTNSDLQKTILEVIQDPGKKMLLKETMNTGRTTHELFVALSSSYSEAEIEEKLQFMIHHNLLVEDIEKKERHNIIKELKVNIDGYKMRVGIVLHGDVQNSMLLNVL